MDFLTLSDLPLEGKRVLIRVDLNVPLNQQAQILDDSRIKACLPSLRYLLKKRARLILLSHLGRPQGKILPSLSLAPCAKRLSEKLQAPVCLAPDCLGKSVEKSIAKLQSGELLLLENLRFYAAEETPDCDPSFASRLSDLGEIYINEAFSCSHRNHTSITKLPSFFRKRAAAGFLMEQEIQKLSLLRQAKKPFFVVLGGAKLSTKLPLIQALLERADALFLGGAMAFTFLQAQGIDVGDSPVDIKLLSSAKQLLKQFSSKIHLPQDLKIRDTSSKNIPKTVLIQKGIPQGMQGVDIGHQTLETWSSLLHKGQTIFWNGPMGIYEDPNCQEGTEMLAKHLANSTAYTVIGGGDSLAAVQKFKLQKNFSYLSTGGGSSLQFLKNWTLPGIQALETYKD